MYIVTLDTNTGVIHMTITLTDKSKVSLRYVKGQAMLTFHGIDKRLSLPVGIVPTIGLLQSLYNSLKG